MKLDKEISSAFSAVSSFSLTENKQKIVAEHYFGTVFGCLKNNNKKIKNNNKKNKKYLGV